MKSILLIEDDRAIREMIKTLLEIEGYAVCAVTNGLEGIKALRAGPPSVILLDMMMPVMNGWDFLDALRSDAANAHVPIIAISAYDEIARSIRPNAYVNKPVQLNQLLKAIEECAA